MKFLANENFPLDSIKYLRRKEFDIKYIGEEFKSITDKEVIDFAIKEDHTILTFDKDYGELIFKFGYKPKQGVIFLRLKEFDSIEPGKIIENIFKDSSFNTKNKLTVFDGESIRQKSY